MDNMASDDVRARKNVIPIFKVKICK